MLIDDAYEKSIHVLILGEIACSPRTSRKGNEKPNLLSSRASCRVRRLHRKEPKLFRQEPEVSYPFASTSEGLRRPASLRQGENEKIDSSSTGYPRPRDHSTGSNLESTLQALATKVGSSDELASELPQGQSETKAGTEHSIEILAGIDQRRLTETSYPRFRIRLKPRSIAEDFSVNESLRRAFIVLTSSQSIALYYRNINTTTITDLRCVSRHCEPKSGSYMAHNGPCWIHIEQPRK